MTPISLLYVTKKKKNKIKIKPWLQYFPTNVCRLVLMDLNLTSAYCRELFMFIG